MKPVTFELMHTRQVTYVLIVTEADRLTPFLYHLSKIRRQGKLWCIYTDRLTGENLFPGCYFDDAGLFSHGYAPVINRGRYFHINHRGKAAYSWRFSDIGQLDADGVVLVQHPRALGWSRFHVPSGTFISNPPRYEW
ncbi:MAG: hypothetical protein RLZZ70_605 [Candidatus Parcubacteria bacterium]